METQVAAPVVVLVAVFARVYFGGVIFHPRYVKVWNVVRRLLVPIIDRVVSARLGISVENEAYREELVGYVDLTPPELARRLDQVAEPEVPLLAGLKTDWEGNTESGTLTVYHGPRPWPGAPRWLRPRQTHMTTFDVQTASGTFQSRLTAHDEANSYRPDKWVSHLFAGSQSPQEGVERAARLLHSAGVEIRQEAEA